MPRTWQTVGRSAVLFALAVLAALAGCADRPAASTGGDVRLVHVADGFDEPVGLEDAGDGSGRLFVVEQDGLIRVVRDGRVAAAAFLDIRTKVKSDGEQGLLGLAFHPRFAENGRFFVHYSDRNGDTAIDEYRVAAGTSDRADGGSARRLLSVDQPYPNHNGGQLAFGPDGFLYIGLGDGGSRGDPHGNGQRLDTLLGKILRIDVDSVDEGLAYAIPPDNPLIGRAGARGEIWAYGLRNPWRFSFDTGAPDGAGRGDLFIADVGQNAVEEIDVQSAGSRGGENYGWSHFEGSERYKDGDLDGQPVGPVAEYRHAGRHCSVTGGHVARGGAAPALEGAYVFGDYCSGEVWTLRRGGDAATWTMAELMDTPFAISAFGRDAAGDLYLVDRGGTIQRFAQGPR